MSTTGLTTAKKGRPQNQNANPPRRGPKAAKPGREMQDSVARFIASCPWASDPKLAPLVAGLQRAAITSDEYPSLMASVSEIRQTMTRILAHEPVQAVAADPIDKLYQLRSV